MSFKRLQLVRTLYRSSQIGEESSSYLLGSCRSYSNALSNGSDVNFKSFHPHLFKGQDGFPLASVKTLTLRSTMTAELFIFMNDKRMVTTQATPSQARQVGTQISMTSPGFIYEPYEPRDKIPFWKRWFTRSGWTRTKNDIILELKSAYAIMKLRKKGYSKSQFYNEAATMYKEVNKDEKKETKIVLSKPLTLEKESDSEEAYRAPNLLQRVISLFKNVGPGSDLTRFQLSPLFNLPKSQLQCYGASVYCTASDLLSMCNRGQSPLDRFISVVAWCISTTRPATFGVAPYNPILGETHHVSKGNLNVLLEQVSHHPPVTALYAKDENENIEMIWCQQPVPKFYGTSVEAQVHGKRQLKLLNHGETYEMNCPRLLFKILPVPGADWVGTVNIRCLETGLVAELSYRSSHSFLGLGGNHKVIKGKILDSSSLKVLYEIDGHWDRTVKLKDTKNGKVRVIYDAMEVISGLQAPILKDAQCVWPTESVHVWSELSQAILRKEWEKAREAKQAVEERQRELLRERESKGETWIPKHFIVSYSKEAGWECSPIHNFLSVAPIIAL